MKETKKRICFSKDKIDRRVKDLAETISRDFIDGDVVIIAVLKGAFMFLADLSRHITIPFVIDFVRLSSYGSATVSSGNVVITKDIELPIGGKDVIIVEDIVDSGHSIAFLRDTLRQRNPNSISICTFLDKKERREVDVKPDYVGFDVKDGFVIGYGLDFDERFRCLPDIYVIEE